MQVSYSSYQTIFDTETFHCDVYYLLILLNFSQLIHFKQALLLIHLSTILAKDWFKCNVKYWFILVQRLMYIYFVYDPSHPARSLFELLPYGRHYRALSTRTTRHRNSLFSQAIYLMNTWQ